jgi:hypothetical protein
VREPQLKHTSSSAGELAPGDGWNSSPPQFSQRALI